MAASTIHSNGIPPGPEIATTAIAVLPGTTLSTNTPAPQPPPNSRHQNPISFPGPSIHGRKTTTTLYEPAQLLSSPSIPALYTIINEAFSRSHVAAGAFPATIDRLPSPEAFYEQVGNDAGTFTIILSWAGTNGEGDGEGKGQAFATCSAHRYVAPVLMAEAGSGSVRSVFYRMRSPAGVGVGGLGEGGEEMWELKLMAVDYRLQGQGVASYLMRLVDEEVVRRVKVNPLRALPSTSSIEEAAKPAEKAEKAEGLEGKVYMVLTTIKECNETFYARRGYGFDYETRCEPGYLGSRDGFHVVHMSKVLDL